MAVAAEPAPRWVAWCLTAFVAAGAVVALPATPLQLLRAVAVGGLLTALLAPRRDVSGDRARPGPSGASLSAGLLAGLAALVPPLADPGPVAWLSLAQTVLLLLGATGLARPWRHWVSGGRPPAWLLLSWATGLALAWQAGARLPAALPWPTRWAGLIWVVQVGVTCLVFSRYWQDARAPRWGLMRAAQWAWLVAATAGVVQGAVNLAASRAAVAAAAQGRVTDLEYWAARAWSGGPVGNPAGLTPGAWVDRFLAHPPSALARAAGRDLGANAAAPVWLAVGDLAARSGAWHQALSAYAAAGQAAPGDPVWRRRWGLALISSGQVDAGLAMLNSGAPDAPGDADTQWGWWWARCRLGQWVAAARAAPASLLPGSPPAAMPDPGAAVVSWTCRALPDDLVSFLAPGARYAVGRTLAAAGWPVLAASAPVGRTGGEVPVQVRVRAADGASGVVDTVQIGAVVAACAGRGYTLVVVADTLVGAFAVWDDPLASRRLLAFVDDLPAGAVVAGATGGPRQGVLPAPAHLALRRLGVQPPPNPQWAHAFVGVKGAAPGSAVDAYNSAGAVETGLWGAVLPVVGAADARSVARCLQHAAAGSPNRAAALLEGEDGALTLTFARVR
jgi:hypothetical protein